MNNDYEKLGAFYLGKEYDLVSRTLKEDPVLYDSKDLNTHAVIIGEKLCDSFTERKHCEGVFPF